MNKDYQATAKFYREWQHTEFQICRRLNYRMPDKLVNAGYAFVMNVKNEFDSNGQFQKNDMVLIQITPEREKREIIKVEFEYGANQHNWDFEIPPEPDPTESDADKKQKKWYGLNLMIRKNYGETFELFIKSSPTYRSFFAIDCRENFILENFAHTEHEINHSLNFTTDCKGYTIYLNKIPEYRFIDDDGKTKNYKDGNLCIVEDDNWSIFYRFLWRRFLSDIENNNLHNEKNRKT